MKRLRKRCAVFDNKACIHICKALKHSSMSFACIRSLLKRQLSRHDHSLLRALKGDWRYLTSRTKIVSDACSVYKLLKRYADVPLWLPPTCTPDRSQANYIPARDREAYMPGLELRSLSCDWKCRFGSLSRSNDACRATELLGNIHFVTEDPSTCRK